ncbi:MAG: hypothetical protein COA79_06500 [Planctomycetota bacterium]|nr:MAG: hypothetical protein COA79_06500 [Planctomycetota bacterium]
MPPSSSENSIIDWKEYINAFVDEMGTINKNNIQKIIPYGDDFFFIDRVYGLTDDAITGEFAISENQPYVLSHFTHNPVMPGCLVAESFAQAGTILIRYNLGCCKAKDIFVGSIEKAKFKTPIKPGQTIKHIVQLKSMNVDLGVARLQGDTLINDIKVASYKLILAILDRE